MIRLQLPSLLLLILRAVVGILLLSLIIHVVDIEKTVASLTSGSPTLLALAFGAGLCGLTLQVLKWHYLVNISLQNTSLRRSLRAFLFGISVGALTPGQLGELVGRPLSLERSDRTRVFALSVVDKLQNTMVISLFGVLALILLMGGAWYGVLTAGGGILAVGGTMLLQPDVVVHCFPRRLRHYLKKILWLTSLVDEFRRLSVHGRVVSLMYSLAFYLTLAIQMILLLNAFTSVHAQSAAIGFAAMLFVKSVIPLSIADIGIREASAVYFFSLLGVEPTAALNAAFLLFVMNVLIPGAAGAFLVPRGKKSSTRFSSSSSAEQ